MYAIVIDFFLAGCKCISFLKIYLLIGLLIHHHKSRPFVGLCREFGTHFHLCRPECLMFVQTSQPLVVFEGSLIFWGHPHLNQ
jgi:hypothetical protein